MESVFTFIYENNVWGNDRNQIYKGSSGAGSEIFFNKETYVPFLKDFIQKNEIKSVVDLGCGNFKCGPLIYDDLDIQYTGYDAYNKVIETNSKTMNNEKYNFIHLDFCNEKEKINGADLCILKDVVQHWRLSNIYTFMDYLVSSKKFKYILLCNCSNQTQNDTDICDGQWRPLSCDYLPLKKYNPIKLYQFRTKEVSLIKIDS
jgi:SAM-dependent methyltransferase